MKYNIIHIIKLKLFNFFKIFYGKIIKYNHFHYNENIEYDDIQEIVNKSISFDKYPSAGLGKPAATFS